MSYAEEIGVESDVGELEAGVGGVVELILYRESGIVARGVLKSEAELLGEVEFRSQFRNSVEEVHQSESEAVAESRAAVNEKILPVADNGGNRPSILIVKLLAGVELEGYLAPWCRVARISQLQRAELEMSLDEIRYLQIFAKTRLEADFAQAGLDVVISERVRKRPNAQRKQGY